MIINWIIKMFQNVVLWFIALMPEIEFTMPDVTGINTSLSYLYYFLSKPVAIALLTSTIFWLTVQPTASLIKFIYRKIPGVD